MRSDKKLVSNNILNIKNNSMGSKGQIATLDASVAFIIVMIIVVTTTTLTYEFIDTSIEREEKINAYKELYFATESLIATSGNPRNWHEIEEFERIGLAKYEENSIQNHELDPDKIQRLNEIPVEEVKEKLALEHRNIEIKIKRIDGEEIVKKTDISPEMNQRIQIKRVAVLKNDLYVIKTKTTI